MGQPIPKQFIKLKGRSILSHTISRVANLQLDGIWVTLPKDSLQEGKVLITKELPEIKVQFVAGGKTRFSSIENALKVIPDSNDAIVCVHDGVRPFASEKLFLECFKTAEEFDSGVSGLASKNTVRLKDGNGFSLLDRNKVFLIQTPQCFKLQMLKKAYLEAESDDFTDDGAVFENKYKTLQIVAGEEENIKITTPSDLRIAEAFLN